MVRVDDCIHVAVAIPIVGAISGLLGNGLGHLMGRVVKNMPQGAGLFKGVIIATLFCGLLKTFAVISGKPLNRGKHAFNSIISGTIIVVVGSLTTALPPSAIMASLVYNRVASEIISFFILRLPKN